MGCRGLISSDTGQSSGGGSRVVVHIAPHSPFIPSCAIAKPHFLASPKPNSMKTSSTLHFSVPRSMDGHGEMGGLPSDNFDPGIMGRLRDDEYESRSGSDNFEGASADDQDAVDEHRPRKKKYHRHTPHQIQELESFFKECPHPDEKQRLELSKRLSLEIKQVKFWFQNRRTQMKTQLERHENIILRQENDKLIAENSVMKNAIANTMCNNCGGPAIPGQISFEEHQLSIENARLTDELNRICALSNKLLGRPLSSLATSMPLPSSPAALELVMGRNEFGGLNAIATNSSSMGLDIGDGIAGTSPMISLTKPLSMGMVGREMPYERSMLIDLALASMDELVKMAQAESPLWIKTSDGGVETLNLEEYIRTFSPCIGIKPSGYVTEASRQTSIVIVNSLAFVETLMDANRWTEMFPCLVASASTVDVISNGLGGTRNGALQVMHAELQVLSPLVPVRSLRFLRFCKQHAEGVWTVVDVSIDINREAANATTFFQCRRLPSGCIVQDMPNGYSKVTWVEHSEYDESVVHQLFHQLLCSGMGFGAQRWLTTLQRQCDSLAILMSFTTNEDHSAINPSGRRSMLKLAQRMVDNFCSGVCASSVRKWDKLCVDNVDEDVRVMTRKSVDDPGEPPGVILSAATSVWIPVSPQRVFNFLRDEQLRSEWDILSNGGLMQEMLHIPKGQSNGNCVSLLRASALNANDNTMLILQETWSDASGSLVVYAPVDTASINIVMHGGDSAHVALLPSGFAIVPDGTASENNCNGPAVKGEGDVGGSLLTVGFQILVNSLPTAKLTVESVETVNNLISCTIQKIKVSLKVL